MKMTSVFRIMPNGAAEPQTDFQWLRVAFFDVMLKRVHSGHFSKIEINGKFALVSLFLSFPFKRRKVLSI